MDVNVCYHLGSNSDLLTILLSRSFNEFQTKIKFRCQPIDLSCYISTSRRSPFTVNICSSLIRIFYNFNKMNDHLNQCILIYYKIYFFDLSLFRKYDWRRQNNCWIIRYVESCMIRRRFVIYDDPEISWEPDNGNSKLR